MPGTMDRRIVVVDVDEASLAEVGRWPWPRDRLAALVDELFARQQVKAVGFDMVFAEPETAERDTRFARALAGRPVVLGTYLSTAPRAHRVGVLPAPLFPPAALQGHGDILTRWTGYTANVPVLAAAAPAAGFFNAVPDPDGQVRSVPLVALLDGAPYEPLSLALFRMATGHPTVHPVWAGTRLAHLELRQADRALAVATDANGRAQVPFRGPPGPLGGSFEYVAAADLLAGRVPAGHLAGRLVLVGATAPGVYDLRTTPVAEVYPGVEIHASLLSGLLDGRLPAVPDWSPAYEVASLAAVVVFLAILLPRLSAAAALATTAAVIAAATAADVAFATDGVLLPLASTIVGAVLTYALVTITEYAREGRHRRSLTRLFGTYVPPELVTEMAKDPARYDMRAENAELTVMFCDMRNFTRVSEQLAPEEVRTLANQFFSAMTTVIRAERGTLDKYIGDALMAFWGAPVPAPDHADRARRAALGMVSALAPLNAALASRNLPPIGIGIGLNTGVVCVGDMGSAQRRSYTVMGDAVNLASRIEALTRVYGVDILAGETTAAADPERWIEVDRVVVKGKARSVTLFTPVPNAALKSATYPAELGLWQLALTRYRLQHWDDAQAALQRLADDFPSSMFTALSRPLGERMARYRMSPPPPDWDGATHFDSK